MPAGDRTVDRVRKNSRAAGARITASTSGQVTQPATGRPLILTSTRPIGRGFSAADGPRRDFELLAQALGGPVSYPGAELKALSRVEATLRVDLAQAVRARRSGASVYVSLSERIGMPLSLLRPHAPHIIFAHLLTSTQKRVLARLTGYLRQAEATLVFSRAQERFLREELGLDERQAQFIYDRVDAQFYYPSPDVPDGGYVLSVGREQRDYQALVDALRPLRLPCVIVAGSTWSHRTVPVSFPDHFEMREGLSYPELRELYQRARVVVVPVYPDIDYAAGVTTIHEAMACARPTIVSDTPGLAGYVRDRENGRLVAAGDAQALGSVIAELWEDREQAERLGAAGRQTVEQERTLERFVARTSALVDQLLIARNSAA